MNPLQQLQLNKKRLLEREFAWIKREFQGIRTLSDIKIYNTDLYYHTYLSSLLH